MRIIYVYFMRLQGEHAHIYSIDITIYVVLKSTCRKTGLRLLWYTGIRDIKIKNIVNRRSVKQLVVKSVLCRTRTRDTRVVFFY